ncbi:glycosyltransferase [Halobacteriales archaeon Cl-PHB]
MTLPSVVAFTDTYLPTVNGVTYTVKTWQERWEARGGQMDVVYPGSDHSPDDCEHPVRSVSFPFYEGYRLGLPQVPDRVSDADVIHAHTPFGVGVGGLRLARSTDAPVVASYHTPTSEYAAYVSVNGVVEKAIRRGAASYEQWFLEKADVVVVPSEETGRHVTEELGVNRDVEVIPNGVDTEFFQPVAGDLRDRFDLPEGPLVGYTGRHGYEKNLELLVEAVASMDDPPTLAFGGDGPAREDLEAAAAAHDLDAHFLGFLDRDDLPAFYAALDVFAFPSPVETQGLVALEANACGTPVAGVDAGALADTIEDGRNGYRAEAVDVDAFRGAIEATLAERETLAENCLASREETSVEHAVDRLRAVYDRVGAAQ